MYNNVRIVMMNTSHPGNIGAVARAMKNMGLSELYLVSPKSFPDIVAERRAAGAKEILASAKVVETFDEAVVGCVSVIGASARGRRIPWPVMNPRDCAAKVREFARLPSEKKEVAVVFGQEDRGLSNEELQRCNYHVHIPSNPDYGSLNLAMAVQVITYEIRMDYLLNSDEERQSELNSMLAPGDEGWDEEIATTEEVEGLIQHMEQVMIDVEFQNPENPRHLVPRLRRLYQRCRMSKIEVNIMRGFLKSLTKALNSAR